MLVFKLMPNYLFFVLSSMIFRVAMFNAAVIRNRAVANRNISSMKFDILSCDGIWPVTLRTRRPIKNAVAIMGMMK